MRTYFDWAVEQGLTPVSPMEGIRLVQEVETGPRWLTRTEQRNLVRAVQRELYGAASTESHERAKRDNAIILLLLHSGLRVGEIARVRWCDLTFNTRAGAVVVRGKGNKTRRVPLNRTVCKALEKWLSIFVPHCEDFVFLSRRKMPLCRSAVWRIVQKYAQRAGIEEMSAHSLRHTCAKNLIDRGVSLDQVAQILGHADVNTTRIYTRPSQADLAAAVERIAWED
jgi:site-specific recombinase XerD